VAAHRRRRRSARRNCAVRAQPRAAARSRTTPPATRRQDAAGRAQLPAARTGRTKTARSHARKPPTTSPQDAGVPWTPNPSGLEPQDAARLRGPDATTSTTAHAPKRRQEAAGPAPIAQIRRPRAQTQPHHRRGGIPHGDWNVKRVFELVSHVVAATTAHRACARFL
jgi:hypothetical protein